MGHIVADDIMELRLRGILEPIEIRDSAGRVMGHYTPIITPDEQALHEKARPLLDPARAERRLAAEAGKGSPLSDILERLRSREKGEI